MKTIEFFRATRDTPRFNKNQKVWIEYNHANHLDIRYKFRGKGRYVSGTIDKFDDKSVDGIRAIEVDDDFYHRIVRYE